MQEVKLGNGKLTTGCYGYSNSGIQDAIDSIKRSWTYQKLKDEEKTNLENIFTTLTEIFPANVKDEDTYGKEWNGVGTLYSIFLRMIGYKPGYPEWRDKSDYDKQVEKVQKKLDELNKELDKLKKFNF